jgi:hypothetical protein
VGLVALPGPGGPTAVGDPSIFGPTLSSEERDRLGVEALAALGYAPTESPTRSDHEPIRPGILFGGVDADPSTFRFGSPAEPLPPGTYDLQAICRDKGHVTVDWRVPGGQYGALDVDCWRDAVPGTTFDLDTGGVIDLTVTGDEWARDRAGFAVTLTDPRVIVARTVLGSTTAAHSAGSGTLGSSLANVYELAHEAGTYELTVACVGAGSVTVTLAAGTATASGTGACTAAGYVTAVTLQASEAGSTMTVTIEPAGAAANAVAFAYQVTRQ